MGKKTVYRNVCVSMCESLVPGRAHIIVDAASEMGGASPVNNHRLSNSSQRLLEFTLTKDRWQQAPGQSKRRELKYKDD